MDLLNALRTNELAKFKREYTWTTKDRRRMNVDEMDTTHLFNSSRLLYNKIKFEDRPAYVRGRRNGNAIYEASDRNAQVVFFFIWEIYRRGNLDGRYRTNFTNFVTSIFDRQFIDTELPSAILRAAETAPPPPEPQEPAVTDPPPWMSLREGRDAIELQQIGTLSFTAEVMRERIRLRDERSLDLTGWVEIVSPTHTGARFQQCITEAAERSGALNRRRDSDTVTRFINAFQEIKTREISNGNLTQRGWQDQSPGGVRAFFQNLFGQNEPPRVTVDPRQMQAAAEAMRSGGVSAREASDAVDALTYAMQAMQPPERELSIRDQRRAENRRRIERHSLMAELARQISPFEASRFQNLFDYDYPPDHPRNRDLLRLIERRDLQAIRRRINRGQDYEPRERRPFRSPVPPLPNIDNGIRPSMIVFDELFEAPNPGPGQFPEGTPAKAKQGQDKKEKAEKTIDSMTAIGRRKIQFDGE